MLAEVRAGTRWWAHLRDLNHEEVQLGLLDEDAEKWQVGTGGGTLGNAEDADSVAATIAAIVKTIR